MSVTIENLRARVETDLDNGTLQRILDAAVKAIDRAAGGIADEAEVHLARGVSFIVLSRRHTAIVSVKERTSLQGSQVTLAADDYREVGDYRVLRASDGTNPAPCWGSEVEITFTPELDTNVRDRVALDLSQVDIKFNAFAEEKSGDWSGKADWMKERKSLLKQVREGRALIA